MRRFLLFMFFLWFFCSYFAVSALEHVNKGTVSLTSNYMGVPVLFDSWFLPSLNYDALSFTFDIPYSLNTDSYSDTYNSAFSMDATTTHNGTLRLSYTHPLRVREFFGWKRIYEFSLGYRYARTRASLSGTVSNFSARTNLDVSDDISGFVSLLGNASFSCDYSSDTHTVAVSAPIGQSQITLGYALSPLTLRMHAHVLPEGFVSINGMDYFFTSEQSNPETTLARHYYIQTKLFSHTLFAHYAHPLSTRYALVGGIRVHDIIASGTYHAITHHYVPLTSANEDLEFDITKVDIASPTRTTRHDDKSSINDINYPAEFRIGIHYTSYLTSHSLCFLMYSGVASVRYNDSSHVLRFKKGISYHAEAPFFIASASIIECVSGDEQSRFPIGEISIGVRIPLSTSTLLDVPLVSTRHMPGSFRFMYTNYPALLEKIKDDELMDAIQKKDKEMYIYEENDLD